MLKSNRKSQFLARVDRVVGASATAVVAATGAGFAGTAPQADAAIIVSPVSNLAIPATIDGVYVNIVTGASAGASFAGFDINPYAGSTAPGPNFFSSTTGSPAGTRGFATSTGTTGGPARNFALGDIVDPALVYNEGVASGSNFVAGQTGYIGFRFRNEALANQTQYGWCEIVPPSTSTIGTAGSLVRCAYDDTGARIAVGAVPEPSSLGLLALGAIGILARRRK